MASHQTDILRRMSLIKKASTVDDHIHGEMRKKRIKHVKIIPSSVKLELAIKELTETKRKQTIGQKWNSALIFSIMWTVYCLVILAYFASTPDFCWQFAIYFFARLILLFPTYSLAYLWGIGCATIELSALS